MRKTPKHAASPAHSISAAIIHAVAASPAMAGVHAMPMVDTSACERSGYAAPGPVAVGVAYGAASTGHSGAEGGSEGGGEGHGSTSTRRSHHSSDAVGSTPVAGAAHGFELQP